MKLHSDLQTALQLTTKITVSEITLLAPSDSSINIYFPEVLGSSNPIPKPLIPTPSPQHAHAPNHPAPPAVDT